MVPFQSRLDVGKLKDERETEEFANRLSGGLRHLKVSGDPEELWSAFKTTILDVAMRLFGTHRQVKRNFVFQGTLDTIDQCSRARVDGRTALFRKLRRKTVRSLRVDKESVKL